MLRLLLLVLSIVPQNRLTREMENRINNNILRNTKMFKFLKMLSINLLSVYIGRLFIVNICSRFSWRLLRDMQL